MKLLFLIILLFSTGCIAENNQLHEQLRVCEIQNQFLTRQLDLAEAKLRELIAEHNKYNK